VATYVLIPGADGRAWYWHRVAPLLRGRGHDVVSVELPVTDDTAGFEEYVAAVEGAIGAGGAELILVAQSLGGLIAPVVADRLPATQLILVNAMVPKAGESPGQWWSNTGHGAARAADYARRGRELPPEFDPIDAFFHDVPAGVLKAAMAMGEPEARFDTLFSQPWPLPRWPTVPTRFLQGRNDRFFPLEFQRRIVADRLGLPLEEMPGGHLVALSRPEMLVQRLEAAPRKG
jgi:pimeloyl-ACP methyl ester carboxylesterase